MSILKREEKKVLKKMLKRVLKKMLKEFYYVLILLIFILKSKILM